MTAPVGLEVPTPRPGVAAPLAPHADQSALARHVAAMEERLAELSRSIVEQKAINERLPAEFAKLVQEQLKGDVVKQRKAALRAENIAELIAQNDLERAGEHVKCSACTRYGSAGCGGVFDATQRFSNLKASVQAHLLSKLHLMAVEVAARAAQLAQLRRATGMALARAVYYNINEAASFEAFSRLVQMLGLDGVNVGTLNHSKRFASSLLECIHEELCSLTKEHLSQPDAVLNGKLPPFAVCADKMTALHHTTQIVACILMCDGELQTMMLSNLVAYTGGTSGNAAGVAARLIDGLSKFISLQDMPLRCASLAVDGAYIHSGVPAAFRDVLNLSAEHWLYGRWDIAHRLELCLADVREDKDGTVALRTVEWYKTLAVDITDILGGLTWGKGYVDLQNLAQELGINMLNPSRFCLTRFAQAEQKVYAAFLRNYPVLVTFYARASTPVDGRAMRNKDEETAYALLGKLTDFAFVANLLIVNDLLCPIRKVSLFAQTVNTLPWEVQEEVDSLIALFAEIGNATRDGPLAAAAEAAANAAERAAKAAAKSGANANTKVVAKTAADKAAAAATAAAAEPPPALLAKHFPLMHAFAVTKEAEAAKRSVFDELKSGTYQGVTLKLPFIDAADPEKGRYDLPQALGVMLDEANDFVLALHHFMVTRFVNCKGAPTRGERGGHQTLDKDGVAARKLVITMGACMDLRKMVATPGQALAANSEQLRALTEVYNMATSAGVVLPPFDTMLVQYKELSTRLYKAAQDQDVKLRWFPKDKRHSGTLIMKDVFTTPALRCGVGDFLYLFQHCALKTANEAVVEGMGSIVDRHADPRRGLSPDHYTMEAVIHFNGPLMHEADDLLRAALDRFFNGKDWHFTQTSACGQAGVYSVQSKVLHGMSRERSKLSFLASKVK